jgi:putative ABC transport system permease protein
VARRVPLARRNILADWRRLAAGIAGVGVALMLVLLLDGLRQGVRSSATTYVDNVGADLYVTQPGVANFLGETSVLPRRTVDVVEATPGVEWAAPVRGQFVVFDLHGKKIAAYAVGSVPGEQGGPWSLSSGRKAQREDEIVVDRTLAQRHGLGTGDVLDVAGRRFRIVGISRRTSLVMMSFVFVTHAATDDMFEAPNTTSYVLVGTDDPQGVTERLTRAGLSVFDRQTLGANDRRLFTGIFDRVLNLMVVVAFAAGTLVIALTVYTSVSERRREYGIVRALGASGASLVGLVIRQTVLLGLAGLAAGALLYLGAERVLGQVRPQFSVALTSASVLRALAVATVMALLAAFVPARRMVATEPASVYRGS